MGRIVAVRHGHAGDRAAWPGDDEGRPLTERGRRQAQGLVPLLRNLAFDELLTSPYLRCRQTLEPLAGTAGLPLTADARLAEGGSLDGLLVAAGADEGCWGCCTHGDVLGDLVHSLVGQGLITDAEARWQKAGSWLLEVTPSGHVSAARYLPPPRS